MKAESFHFYPGYATFATRNKKKMISNWSVKIPSVFLQCVHGPKGLKREFSLFFVFDQMNSVGLLYYINNVHTYKIQLCVLSKNWTSFHPVAQAHTHTLTHRSEAHPSLSRWQHPKKLSLIGRRGRRYEIFWRIRRYEFFCATFQKAKPNCGNR